jgi:outer membrane lipoprotein-sorting protein
MSPQRARASRFHAIRRSIAACLAAALLAVTPVAALGQKASPSTAIREGSFDDLYRRGQQMNAALKTLTARFTETTSSSLLTRPLVSRGTIAVERPSRVILRYSEPETRVVLIDGDRMTVSWPGQNLRQVSDIGTTQRRVQKYFINSTAAELRQQFDIDDRAASERPGAFQLSFTPKRKQIREGLSRVDLWVDRTSLILSAMRMIFANGEEKLMVFEDVVQNGPLGPDTFAIDAQ